MSRPLSVPALTVLHAVADGHQYGFDIIDATGLPGGTVYPALTRMEREGWLRSAWEDQATARGDRRPPRRYYRITASGLRVLAAALDRVHALRPVKDLRGVRPARARS